MLGTIVNTATILTFVILMIVVSAASMVLGIAGFDVSWMIDQASGSISTCSPGYREYTDAQIQQLATLLMSPDAFINFNTYSEYLLSMVSGISVPFTAEQFALILKGALLQSGSWGLAELGAIFGEMTVEVPNVMRDVFTMFAWGAISLAAAFFMFLRREF